MVRRVVTLYVSVLVMLLAMTWLFLGMRSVMDIGGTCASGGPYVVANPCPEHVAAFVTLSVPLMLVAAFVGSAVAMSLGAPNLLLPMWWLLFGSLGWNFLDYGVLSGDVVWGWAICGIFFWLMALPALLMQLPWGWTGPASLAERNEPSTARWVLPYVVLGSVGAALGWWTFSAWT